MTPELLAGAATASIAPRAEDLDRDVYLGGFGSYRSRRASGVHDEPQCRVLALSDGTTAVVIAVLDLVGAGGPLLAQIRDDAARLTNIDPAQIIVCCTHSHASPDLQGLWGGVPADYRTHIAHRASSAIWQAVRCLEPVTASAATTPLDGPVRNRRGWPETDTALTSLKFAARSDDRRIATLVNYACHPTATGRANTDVSRDWCGYTADAVEREAGGVAVFVNGAIGDVAPAADGGFDAAATLGTAVAAHALESLASATDISGQIDVRMRALELPLNFERLSQRVQDSVGRAGPALAVLAKTGGLHGAAVALHAAGRSDVAQVVAALEGMSERRMTHRDGRTYLQTHCGYLRLGNDVEVLCAPGELLTRLALPLRAALGAPHRMIFGLAQDTLGYFIPEDEWMTGRNNNYEESASTGRRSGTVLADALLSLIAHDRSRA
ncbi:MAG TPA: hypothetical protein VFY79_05375 [Dehalococcoidia bacterium]|nr:hypothetical protein [Dehalococcoidia bacterium]